MRTVGYFRGLTCKSQTRLKKCEIQTAQLISPRCQRRKKKFYSIDIRSFPFRPVVAVAVSRLSFSKPEDKRKLFKQPMVKRCSISQSRYPFISVDITYYWRGRLNTVPCSFSFKSAPFCIDNIFYLFRKQGTLIRGSTALSLPPQLEFPANVLMSLVLKCPGSKFGSLGTHLSFFIHNFVNQMFALHGILAYFSLKRVSVLWIFGNFIFQS